MNEATVEVFADRAELVANAASVIAAQLQQLLSNQQSVHLALTGGTVGTDVLEALSHNTKTMALANLHIWWIDERFVPSSSKDRNELQARLAWLDSSAIPPENIHAFPSSDVGSIEAAADQFSKLIESINPSFDLMLLGLGEDGHIASLFPGSQPDFVGEWVVIEKRSPKPPALRLSLSMSAINSAKEIVFLVSGLEKAQAVAEVLSGESDLPASFVNAENKTTWLIDSQAASRIISS
jgi:6-phosphogluconolactonase